METKIETIKDFLETFSEPHRSLALKNTSPALLEELAFDPQHAIRSAFVWELSPEGEDYWRTFHDSLLN